MNSKELVQKAIEAPSSHNTQPWLFRLENEAIEIWADRTRALPVNDPFDRELTISCGAAFLNLRVAAAAHGVATSVRPGGEDPDHLATIRLGEGRVESSLAPLAPSIDDRFSTRESFENESLPDTLLADMDAAVELEGARLHEVDQEDRSFVGELVAEGDRVQFANPSWRRELASWMHSTRDGDGLAMSPWVAPISRLVVRNFDMGDKVGQTDEELAREAPALVAISTARDDEDSWLSAGQALQRALLIAAAQEVQAGYLNQPCQLVEIRGRLAKCLSPGRYPQVLLRLGVAEPPSLRAPRRPVEEVLLP